jgi:hypothetical protein
MISLEAFPAGAPERLALEFFARVWAPPHDLSAIDELMTEDYVIITGGAAIRGRDNFKQWVKEFQTRIKDVTNATVDIFSNAAGDRVVSRWVCRGMNNGMFGLVADDRPIAFTGIAIWLLRDGRLAQCWVERAGYELYSVLLDSGAEQST